MRNVRVSWPGFSSAMWWPPSNGPPRRSGALVVAHRLSTVARMYQLLVLDRGQIAERGTHQELLRLGGTYARLWQHQSGGFLDEDTTAAMLPEAPKLSA